MVEQFRDTVPLNKGEQRQLVHYIDGVCNLTVETQWWYSIYVYSGLMDICMIFNQSIPPQQRPVFDSLIIRSPDTILLLHVILKYLLQQTYN